MTGVSRHLKFAVAAFVAYFAICLPAIADEAEVEALFEGLKTADPRSSAQIETRLYEIWSQSGSASIDLLLERGRKAMEEGDTSLAIEHFSAMIDHAPEFAEGYNARATAFYLEGRFGLSLNDIQETLARNPRHFGAIGGLALILEELGRPEDALAAWRQVELIHPNREGLSDAIRRLERQVEGEAI